jgi:alpha-L-rhamnosidase
LRDLQGLLSLPFSSSQLLDTMPQNSAHCLKSANWIAAPWSGGPATPSPCPFFRKTFQVDGAVESAVLTVTALGLYHGEINGRIIDDAVFRPGWTDYSKRVQVQTFDVTDLLVPGENALGIVLGDGWYAGFVGWIHRQSGGDRPRLKACLELSCQGGGKVVLTTDATWQTATGPLLESDLLMGEWYDARRELTGWSSAGIPAGEWQPARVLPPEVEPELSQTIGPPVRRAEVLPAQKLQPVAGQPEGVHRYDLGQNISGRIRLRIAAPSGTILEIRHAEMLNPDGSLYVENLRRAKATDGYVCQGGDSEEWEPLFTFHGFRYVEAKVVPPRGGDPESARFDIEAVVLHSDIPKTGHFECSNPKLNQLWSNIDWGQRGNFLEVPTDCPQRDERLGWTGDAQVFVRTACFNCDVRLFFHKWMRDLRDGQLADGAVQAFAPNPGVLEPRDGGPAWADAMVICPWTIYLCYGDMEILRVNYEAMTRFMDHMDERASLDGVRAHPDLKRWQGFGDWLALDNGDSWIGRTPIDLIGTAFHFYCAGIMVRTARLLGHTQDAARFEQRCERVRDAFVRRYFGPEGLFEPVTQTALVLVLHFGIVDGPQREACARRLVRMLEENNGHLQTGFVGTPYLLHALESVGELETAYRLLEKESYPSWLFPVNNGATTIWERWDGWTPDKGFQTTAMNSFNHYAYGAVGDWMVRSVAGLETAEDPPGYRSVIFRPRPGGSLRSARASLQTAHGGVAIAWTLEGNTLVVHTTLPEGCRARFDPPGGFHFETTDIRPGICRLEGSK